MFSKEYFAFYPMFFVATSEFLNEVVSLLVFVFCTFTHMGTEHLSREKGMFHAFEGNCEGEVCLLAS